MDLALDADAFNFLRKLGLLADLALMATAAQPKIRLHTTSFVANHELNSVSSEIKKLCESGALQVHAIKTGTPTFRLFRELQKEYDKGESELSAWITTDAIDHVLVSCDHAAPKLANRLRFRHLDLGQLACVLAKDALLAQEIVEERLIPWANPHVGLGRPTNWVDLSTALKAYSIKSG